MNSWHAVRSAGLLAAGKSESGFLQSKLFCQCHRFFVLLFCIRNNEQHFCVFIINILDQKISLPRKLNWIAFCFFLIKSSKSTAKYISSLENNYSDRPQHSCSRPLSQQFQQPQSAFASFGGICHLLTSGNGIRPWSFSLTFSSFSFVFPVLFTSNALKQMAI